MIDFNSATGKLRLDPSKRVHYSYGLVLGVDEFTQEQAYAMARRRLHNRLLHGYGTVSGLAIVPPEPGSATPELHVTPGWAVDPYGREIRVPNEMCVRLNEWLTRQRPELEPSVGAQPGALDLCVVLCYRECATDDVPVPGEPCRVQADAMQPSRVTESFDLRLCLSSQLASPPEEEDQCSCPTQPEEEAVRAFGALLERIEVTNDALDFASEAELLALVRALADPTTMPLESPPAAIYLAPRTACAIMDAMLRVWVTEVRPALLGAESGDGCEQNRCVLLAELIVPIDAQWRLAGAVAVDESRRPYLLHTRMLQEWLTCGRRGSGGISEDEVRTFGQVEAVDAQRLRITLHHDVQLNVPRAAVTLRVNGQTLSPQPGNLAAVAGRTNVFELTGLTLASGDSLELRFDATQITQQTAAQPRLADLLADPDYAYLDRFGNELRVFGHFAGGGVAPGPIAHASLSGLAADDHTQYFNIPRGDARYALRTHSHALRTLSDVDANAPIFNEDVLTFRNNVWLPDRPPPPCVRMPGAPVIGIVAAGVFRLTARTIQPLEPVYNELNAILVGPQDTTGIMQILIEWRGTPPYRDPNTTTGFTYVVKGSIFNPDGRGPAVFDILEFQPRGIVLSLHGIVFVLGQRALPSIAIEVTQIGALP